MTTKLEYHCQRKVNQTDYAQFGQCIPDYADDWQGEAIDKEGDEPLEDPGGIVERELRVKVIVQAWI